MKIYSARNKLVYLGSDHRGYYLKEKIKSWLTKWGYQFDDLGAHEFDPTDDYVLSAEKVASIVPEDKGNRGILICGSGVGVDITANKFDGVRASFGKSPDQVKAGRHDDDMNILILASDFTSDAQAKQMTEVFLKTKFGGRARYKRRLADIAKLEVNN